MGLIEHTAGIVGSAKSGVVFTGAGMSTESGIPDFRSPGGVWSRHKMVYYDEFLASKEARARYWRMRVDLHRECAGAKPNAGHYAIARLEELGRAVGVVTQNIDGLHQDAGSKRVIELHGTNRVVGCVYCGKEWEPEAVIAMIEAGDEAPDCDACGGPLKSKTVSFGQPMPEKEMAEAGRLSVEADVYLAIGSSLTVEPAASLPRIAKDYGATLIIINKTETPLDGMADIVINEAIGEVLTTVVEHCEGNA